MRPLAGGPHQRYRRLAGENGAEEIQFDERARTSASGMISRRRANWNPTLLTRPSTRPQARVMAAVPRRPRPCCDDVGCDAHGPVSRQSRDRLVEPLTVARQQSYFRAATQQALDRAQADALGCAGHHDHLVFYERLVHRPSPFRPASIGRHRRS